MPNELWLRHANPNLKQRDFCDLGKGGLLGRWLRRPDSVGREQAEGEHVGRGGVGEQGTAGTCEKLRL